MVKKKLILFCVTLLSSFLLIHPADSANLVHSGRKGPSLDQMGTMVQSGQAQELFPELSAFYAERLNLKGVDTSVAQVTKVLNDLKRECFKSGHDVGFLMKSWAHDFENDKLGGPESGFFSALEMCCNELSLKSKSRLRLSPEQIFRFEAEKILNLYSNGVREELYAFVWNKLQSQHDCANFTQSLYREARCLTQQAMGLLPANTQISEYPLFEQLLNMYGATFQLCLTESSDKRYSEFSSDLLSILKKIEQNEPRFARLPNNLPIELFVKHEDVCALKNAMKKEFTILKDKTLQDFKSFVAHELEIENNLDKASSISPQLKNKMRSIIISTKTNVNNVLLDEAINLVSGLYNNNEQILNNELIADIKLYNKMILAVRNLKEKKDNTLYAKLLEEGLLELGHGDKLFLSLAAAPLLTKLGIAYDHLLFLLESLREKKIVLDENSLFSVIRFYQKKKEKGLLDIMSKEVSTISRVKIEEDAIKIRSDIIGLCSENMAATFVQVRKEHAQTMKERAALEKERAALELASKQEQENVLALLAQEKANNRRIAKEKKHQEQETLRSVFLGWLGRIKDKHAAIEEQVQSAKRLFYLELQEPNKKHADMVETIREQRKSLPLIEEDVPANPCILIQEEGNVQDIQLQAQKESVRQARIARRVERKKIKDALADVRRARAVFEAPRLEEKSNKYSVDFLSFIAKTKRQAELYDQQQQQLIQEQHDQQRSQQLIQEQENAAALRLAQQQAELERAASHTVAALQPISVRQNNPYGQQVLPVRVSLPEVEAQSVPFASVVRQNNPYGYELNLYRLLRNH